MPPKHFLQILFELTKREFACKNIHGEYLQRKKNYSNRFKLKFFRETLFQRLLFGGTFVSFFKTIT